MDEYTFLVPHAGKAPHTSSAVHLSSPPPHTPIVADTPDCLLQTHFRLSSSLSESQLFQVATYPSHTRPCNHLKVNLICLGKGNLFLLTVSSLVCTLPSVASGKWGDVSRTLPGKLCLLIKRDPKRWALMLLDIVRVRVPELWQLPWDHREQCEDGRAERWEEHACLMKPLKSWLNPEAELLPVLYLDELECLFMTLQSVSHLSTLTINTQDPL